MHGDLKKERENRMVAYNSVYNVRVCEHTGVKLASSTIQL